MLRIFYERIFFIADNFDIDADLAEADLTGSVLWKGRAC